MEIRINVATFKYNGEAPYTFRASDFRRYVLKKGDLITLEDNHYARFLRRKSDFIELPLQEKSKTAKKQEGESQEQGPQKQENESQKESQVKAQEQESQQESQVKAQDSKTPEA